MNQKLNDSSHFEGNTPKGWATLKLIDLMLSIESGSRPKGGVKGFDKGIPSIGGEHLNNNGNFSFENIRYVPYSFAENMNRGQIQQNNILIVKDGATTGKVSFVDNSFPYKKAVINEHIFLCRPSTKINSRYIFWFLWSPIGQETILKNFKGSAQGGINSSFAENVKIPVAPKSEQDDISLKLDLLKIKIDSIKAKDEQINFLEDKAFESFIYDGSELFESVKLEKHIEEKNDRIGKSWQNKPLIGVSKEQGITKLRTGGKKTFESYKVVKPGDFIYNPMRVDIGSVGIWEGSGIALTSPDYVVFSPKETISSLLLLSFLKSSLGLSEINKHTKGSVRSRLYYTSLIDINFPYCGEDEQTKAQRVLQSFKYLKEQSHIIIEKLDSTLNLALQKAFSGTLVPQNKTKFDFSKLLEEIEEERKLFSSKQITARKKTTKKMKSLSKSIIDVLSDSTQPLDVREVWEKSEFANDIDSFYAELKKLVEIDKTVVEVKSAYVSQLKLTK